MLNHFTPINCYMLQLSPKKINLPIQYFTLCRHIFSVLTSSRNVDLYLVPKHHHFIGIRIHCMINIEVVAKHFRVPKSARHAERKFSWFVSNVLTTKQKWNNIHELCSFFKLVYFYSKIHFCLKSKTFISA